MKRINGSAVVILVASALALMALVASAAQPSAKAARQSAADESMVQKPVPAAVDYYVTGRYYCVDNSDGSEHGTCDITTHASSCQAAYDAQKADVASRGDVCRSCTAGVTDNTRHYSGKMEWIHLGPCQAGN
jgi:hypothetical protein